VSNPLFESIDDPCYCLDTSFFINGWRKHYGIEVFPGVWDHVDDLIKQRTVFSCEEVYRELKKKDDDVFAWAKGRKEIFQKPSRDTAKYLREVMRAFPNLAAVGRSKNRADPWVIAEAMVLRAHVVTTEEPDPKMKQTKPPKIPTVCEKLGIRWLSPLAFFANSGMKLEKR
jgi:hypothetical protein